MAQIGEFAFVLLSVASQLGLMPYQVYMLLMGESSLFLSIALGLSVLYAQVVWQSQLSNEPDTSLAIDRPWQPELD